MNGLVSWWTVNPSSDAVQHRTCTTRAVVRSGHCTTTCAVKKNWRFFFVSFRPSLTPFLDTPSPGTKLYFFLPQKKKSTVCKNRGIDEERLHRDHRRPTHTCHPCQRTTVEQYQKWRPTISWAVLTLTTVTHRRVTKKLAYFTDWDTPSPSPPSSLTHALRYIGPHNTTNPILQLVRLIYPSVLTRTNPYPLRPP